MTLRRDIEAEATLLLNRHSSAVPPIDIEDVAKRDGVVVARHQFDGHESGFALSQNGHRLIGVNSRTTKNRQRFTIAHELGHLTLHHKPLIVDHSILLSLRDETSSLGTKQEEVEANAFAAAILMPEDLVRHYLNLELKVLPSISRDLLIPKLAKIFDVSSDAMGYRMVNLSLITGWI